MAAVAASRTRAAPVLGVCNGFQMLCEAGSCRACCARTTAGRFVCRDVDLVVEAVVALDGHSRPARRSAIPVKHHDGAWYVADGQLERRRRGQSCCATPRRRTARRPRRLRATRPATSAA
jgi:phosphoribosylformylglycinamidine synthase